MKEAIWLKNLVTVIGLIDDNPVPVLTDSRNAMELLIRHGYNASTKWLNIRYYFVRHAVEQGEIEFSHVSGDDNLADQLTKPYRSQLIRKWITKVGLN